jgi:NAD-reducing hydrogenase small subunit
MRNMVPLKDCLAEAYVDSPTAVAGAQPVVPLHRELPVLTTKVYPCRKVVKMDYFIPGCPPSADAILDSSTT